MGVDGFTQFDAVFAAQLKAIRRDRGMSQEVLSEEMSRRGYSLHVTAVGKIERNDRRVSIGEAAAMADILETPLEQLLGGELSLQSALSAHGPARDALTQEINAYLQSLLAVAVAADGAAELSRPQRDWLRIEMLRQTPARLTSDAGIALEAAVTRNAVDADGEFVGRLLRQVREDSARVHPDGQVANGNR